MRAAPGLTAFQDGAIAREVLAASVRKSSRITGLRTCVTVAGSPALVARALSGQRCQDVAPYDIPEFI